MPEKNDSFEWDLFLKFTAACVSKTIVYPLDLIKTRKQVVRYPFTASNGKTYSGTILGITQQLADEGFVNMARGLTASCFKWIGKQVMNAALKDTVKPFLKNVFIIEKDSSYFKRLLYKGLFGGMMGGLYLTVFYGLDRYITVSALPPECVTEPSTIYDLYSGFGLSVLGMMLWRGLYVGIYDIVKPHNFTGFWGKFTSGFAVTTLTGLILYPLGKIALTQMVHCCTASKAISIIHDHPDGLWEGYMGGCKENIIRGLLGTMVLISFDYLKGWLKSE